MGKSGTNEWHFGASAIFEPDSFKLKQHDLYWRPDSQTSSISNTAYKYAKGAKGLYQPLGKTKNNAYTYSAYIGGQ